MTSEKELLIRLDQVGFSIQGREILRAINLEVKAGGIITLIGPNGAGKTSLLKVMLGLQNASSGQVFRKAGLAVGYVPQRFQVPDTMPLTVGVFLRLAGELSADVIQSTLQEVGLDVPSTQSVQTLSGGEFQRLLLTRALLRKPEVLVLDEPAQGLDFAGEAQFYHMINELCRRYECAVVMVSHDLHLVMATTDQVVCLNTHICCQGRPDSISKDPEYLQLFGEPLANEIAVYHHDHDHHHAPNGSIIHDDKDINHG